MRRFENKTGRANHVRLIRINDFDFLHLIERIYFMGSIAAIIWCLRFLTCQQTNAPVSSKCQPSINHHCPQYINWVCPYKDQIIEKHPFWDAVTAFHLLGAKVLPEILLTYILVKFQSKYHYSHSAKCIRIYGLQYGGYFIRVSTSHISASMWS